ncbi:T9SS type A sorting domain-containing protein [Pedobacter sp.]|uniref:T9SS type A sorting domain-containing protein n=1 Tax=Pedobacter sp. TaxID=1411316 RepID=UPI003D7FF190
MKATILLILLLSFVFNIADAQAQQSRLSIALSRSVFADSVLFVFNTNGENKLNDRDAPKISEGYVSISALHSNTVKMAIEEMAYPDEHIDLPLSVKGYAAGLYKLTLSAADFKSAGYELTLIDQLLDKKVVLQTSPLVYSFTMDSLLSDSSSNPRFVMRLQKVNKLQPVKVAEGALLAYPNPFRDKLSLDVKNNAAAAVELAITDLYGNVVWRKQFTNVQHNDILELSTANMIPGMYLLLWKEAKQPLKSKTLKIIKQ